MKILLDTHIFLWYITADQRLPASAVSSIREPSNEVFLSAISVWEASVKHQPGRLTLPEPAHNYIPQQRGRHRIASLPLDEESVSRLRSLPLLHKDPFDRMLLCQAIQHDLTLISTDDAIRSYAGFVSLSP